MWLLIKVSSGQIVMPKYKAVGFQHQQTETVQIHKGLGQFCYYLRVHIFLGAGSALCNQKRSLFLGVSYFSYFKTSPPYRKPSSYVHLYFELSRRDLLR